MLEKTETALSALRVVQWGLISKFNHPLAFLTKVVIQRIQYTGVALNELVSKLVKRCGILFLFAFLLGKDEWF